MKLLSLVTPASMLRAVAVATLMALRGWKRRSLTPSGALAAWAVGFLSLCCGLRGFLLLLFYVAGTKATKYKSSLKSNLDHSAAESACRGPSQVLACSVFGVIFQLAHACYYGVEQSIDFGAGQGAHLACALIAHHATNLADTLASELGILSRSPPLLVTSGRTVPPGTNGGVTLAGTGWSALGGSVVGLGAAVLDAISGFQVQPLAYLLFGTLCGILGSLVDSLLGATLQLTTYDPDKKVVCHKHDAASTAVHVSGRDVLSNAQVNVASILITSVAGAMLGPYFFR